MPPAKGGEGGGGDGDGGGGEGEGGGEGGGEGEGGGGEGDGGGGAGQVVTEPPTLVGSRVVAQVQMLPDSTLTLAPAPWAGIGIREEVSQRRSHRGHIEVTIGPFEHERARRELYIYWRRSGSC